MTTVFATSEASLLDQLAASREELRRARAEIEALGVELEEAEARASTLEACLRLAVNRIGESVVGDSPLAAKLELRNKDPRVLAKTLTDIGARCFMGAMAIVESDDPIELGLVACGQLGSRPVEIWCTWRDSPEFRQGAARTIRENLLLKSTNGALRRKLAQFNHAPWRSSREPS